MKVLITGASSGIGLEMAKILSKREDVELFLVARDKKKLQAIGKELGARTIVADLAEPDSAYMIHTRLKRVDILINNAGFGDATAFASEDYRKLADMMHVNMNSLTLLTRLYLPGMIERGKGKIMNVASTAAFAPGPFMAVYYATKAYVVSFSEALSVELEGTGVSVTTLCPGATKTNFAQRAHASKSLFKGNIPSAREVARFGLKAMFAGKGLVVHGGKNKFLAFFSRLISRKSAAHIAKKMNT